MAKNYALDTHEMASVTKRLKHLDKIHEKNIKEGAFINFPDRMEIWDNDYRLIGYAVFIDAGCWAFEAVTEKKREKKGKL